MAKHLSELDAWERQRLVVLDGSEEQEQVSRDHVSWRAILQVGIGLGAYFFIFPGGTPWTSGSPGGVMGRAVMWSWPLAVLAHMALCLVNTAAIAHVVYAQRAVAAFFMGAATGVGLFILNMALFAASGPRSDGRAFAAHLIFGGFAALMYKGLSVPPPKMVLDGQPVDTD
jgi:hypothetical protein